MARLVGGVERARALTTGGILFALYSHRDEYRCAIPQSRHLDIVRSGGRRRGVGRPPRSADVRASYRRLWSWRSGLHGNRAALAAVSARCGAAVDACAAFCHAVGCCLIQLGSVTRRLALSFIIMWPHAPMTPERQRYCGRLPCSACRGYLTCSHSRNAAGSNGFYERV